ncbi:ABC-2 family transporter permease [Geochorda subterranea]|uniref:TspO/MBR related protein n=1 Tax=Geochorda subterranea TaxID=3109564 RepID=A0ABZ1BQ64_9FIRM|nr:hypothetical protein [Limnochorda sp. LNt]WRP14551.1 hypothetical protein VLY81_14230 [Limnochorda sp. LNt]
MDRGRADRLVLIFAAMGSLGPGTWGRLDPASPWHWMLAALYNWWPFLWASFGTAILAAEAVRLEEGAGAWRALRVHPAAPVLLYLGRAVALVPWHFASNVGFVGLVVAIASPALRCLVARS